MSHRKTRSRAEPMRTLRIICNDPDATDSSDDEGPAGAKKINRIIHQVCYPIRDPSKPPSKETKACPKSSPLPAAEPVKYRGVRKRYSGRWAAEIRHPIERRRVWLGTHTTPEEASRAYERKRLEFEALARSVVVSKRVESSKQKKEVVVYGSDDSSRGGSAVSLPSMKAESGKGINVIKADVGESGALSEELEELARFGSEMDLDFGLDLLVVGGDELGDPLGFGGGNFGIEEFPISDLESFDDLLGPLPDFNLDFDMDVYNEALAWIDDMAPPVDVAWP